MLLGTTSNLTPLSDRRSTEGSTPYRVSANLSSPTGSTGATQNIRKCFHASKTCFFNSLLRSEANADCRDRTGPHGRQYLSPPDAGGASLRGVRRRCQGA